MNGHRTCTLKWRLLKVEVRQICYHSKLNNLSNIHNSFQMHKDLDFFKLIRKQLDDKLNFLKNFQLNKSYIELHLINCQFTSPQEHRQRIASTIKDLKRKTKSLNLIDEKSLLIAYAAELDSCYEFLVEDQTNLEASISRSTRKLRNIYLIHRLYKRQEAVLQTYKVLHLNIINLRRSLSKRNVAKYLLKHLIQVTKSIKINFSSSMEDHSTSSCDSFESSSFTDGKSTNIIEDNVDNSEVLKNSFSICAINHSDSTQDCCQKSESGRHNTLELTTKYKQCDDKSVSNTDYIKNRLGQPLRKALAYLVVHQPSDPILILSHFLLKYRFNILNDLVGRDESQALTQERIHISTASEMPECDPCSRYRQVD